jgi:hypothetical protein
MKWRLLNPPAKSCTVEITVPGGKAIILDVDQDGIFEWDGEQTVPLYAFAAIVGSRRDRRCASVIYPPRSS